ncbi:hypothetical protein ACI2KR_26925 [Pseudomonas luteola]
MNFKQSLIDKFSSEERIGIQNLCHWTGLTEEEFGREHPGEEFNGEAVLPDGRNLAICTNGADYVVKTLGEGARYGFFVDKNPTVMDSEIIATGGHDFAVIRNRFIVDLWISHFTGCEKQVVFDLWDKKDHSKIKELYGDPSCWSCYVAATDKVYDPHEIPDSLKVALGPKRNDPGLCP